MFKYPYTTMEEFNLNWVIRLIREMNETIKTFVSTNAIKYANPFQWNITSQYEKNTVVIEPVSGIAYLSVAAVPQGVAISNTDYWTPVFDLGTLFYDINRNFTEHDELLNIYSSDNYNVGDWLLWKNKLYEVIAPITTGNALAINSNIKLITVEEVVTTLISYVNSEVNTINGAITILQNTKPGYYTVKDMVDNIDADNAICAFTYGYYGASDGGAATYVIRNIVASDIISATVDYTTSSQGLVRLSATKCAVIISDVVNILQYGIKADGATPCNVEIDAIINYNDAHERKNIYFPRGSYLFSTYLQSLRQAVATLPIKSLGNIEIYGDGIDKTVIKTIDADVFQLNAVCDIRIHDLSLTASVSPGVTYGCNGVSMTNGTNHIEIWRVKAYDLPVYNTGTYADGSKAFTCQTGNSSVADVSDISIHDCYCANCAYGFEASFLSQVANANVKNITVVNNFFNVFYVGLAFNGYCTTSAAPNPNNSVLKNNHIVGAPVGSQLTYANGVVMDSNTFEFKVATLDSRITSLLYYIVGCHIVRNFYCIISNNVYDFDNINNYLMLIATAVGDPMDMTFDSNMFTGATQLGSYPINTYSAALVEGGGYPDYCSFFNNKSSSHGVVVNPVVKSATLHNYIAGQVD